MRDLRGWAAAIDQNARVFVAELDSIVLHEIWHDRFVDGEAATPGCVPAGRHKRGALFVAGNHGERHSAVADV